MIQVALPGPLRALARVDDDLLLAVTSPVTIGAVLDAVESRYPMLRGTIRDHVTGKRRAFIRFYACGQDLSMDPPDTPVPGPVAEGKEPLLIIGAISGG